MASEQALGFTDGKPRIATERDLRARWSAGAPGELFLCGLCGHKFELGETWRFVYANGQRPAHGNFLVCKSCDGEDVLQRWQIANESLSDLYNHPERAVWAVAKLQAACAERDARIGELERGVEEVLQERDEYQEAADNLAYAIAPQEVIGEHSSANNPWTNALEVAGQQEARIAALEAQLAAEREARERAEKVWRCFHCGEVFTDPVAAEEHFGQRQLPGPNACTKMLEAVYEAFEQYGVHRNFHNAASVRILVDLCTQRAEAQVQRLREALEKYGSHEWNCPSTHGTGLPCDCEFGAALAQTAEKGDGNAA